MPWHERTPAKRHQIKTSTLLRLLNSGRKRRRPDDGSMPALAEPPRGPLPLAGAAEAPLEFD